MPCSSWVSSFTFTITFPSLSFGFIDLITPDAVDHVAGILGRYSAFRSTSGMGRMDRLGINNLDSGERNFDMCNAKDFGEPKSPKEEDSRKCGDEWGELSQQPKRGSG